MFFQTIHTFLRTEWISWLIHFGMFFVLCRWSGIKWQWALILVFGIEVWETADWALENPLRWWVKPDTWMDIFAGCAGIFFGNKK